MNGKKTLKVESKRVQGFQIKNTIRDFEIIADEPEEMGGEDTGPTTLELILAALGSCTSMVSTMVARKMRIDLEDVEVTVEGDFDPRGVQGKEDVRPGFSEIRTSVKYEGELSDDDKEKLLEKVKELCPTEDTITKPVNVQLKVD